MSSPVARKTASATLVIEEFTNLTSYHHVFLEIDGYSVIMFGIQPKTVVINENYVAVYFVNFDDAFKFRANVHILNLQEFTGTFGHGVTRNLFSLLPRFEVFLDEPGYLYNDKLTLLCEFEVIEDEQDEKTADTILFEDFQSLLSGGKFADFTMIVGKNRKQFNVHKNILAARSPVFAAMFEHDCEEKRLNKVNITDMDEEVCGEMMSYIYTGKVKGLDRYAMELLVAADKYQLSSLSSICSEYMCNHLTVESVVNVLILADLHQELALKSKCIEFICANVDQVESTDGWKELDTNAKLLKELFAYSAKKK